MPQQPIDTEVERAAPAPTVPAFDWRTTWRRLGWLAPLAVLASTAPVLGLVALGYYRAEVASWIGSFGGAALAIYVAFFVLTSGLALLPTHVQAIVGGWLFQFSRGGPAAVAGAVGGAILGFILARLAGGDRATTLLNEHPKARAVYRALLDSGRWRRLGLVTLVRFTPSSPFALTNFVLAAARVPFWEYVVCTAVGIAPRTLAAAYIGASLTDITETTPTARWLKIGGIVVAIITILIIGKLANDAIARVTNKDAAAESSSP